MNLFKTACIAAILLANVVSTATADDVRWINYSCSGGSPYQGGNMTEGDLDSSRYWKSAYIFYNELRVVGGDKIVLTVWGFADENAGALMGPYGPSCPLTSFKFPARSFVVYRTFGGDQITGFKPQGFSQFTNYHFDWEREYSYYNGPEYDYGVGVVNCDIVRIIMGCTHMKIYGDRPGMDYGMSWVAGGGMYVRTIGAVRNNFPRTLFR
jgi:hypothetical protein